MAIDLTVIILTKNEALHITRCLERLAPLQPRQVFVVDCFSTDGTQALAQAQGATVVEHAWPGNQAEQFNWALDHCPIQSTWVLRLDADEYLMPETIPELQQQLATVSPQVSGMTLPLVRMWMGERMVHGLAPIILTRVFRFGKGRCEVRLMDEHIAISEGELLTLKGGFADDNLQPLAWWTQKHVGYALREAVDLLQVQYDLLAVPETTTGALAEQAARKREKKLAYARLPLFWRALAYFLYRYVARGGFLDGKAGFLWHVLQGFWYRTYVDATIFEILKVARSDHYTGSLQERLIACLVERYGFSRTLFKS